MKWFDREFRFDLPAWMYPNVLERLRGTPARLEERCTSVPRRVLVHRPAPGRWSIQDNVGHLLDLETLWWSRIGDFVSGREILEAADVTNRRTHEARHNERQILEILREFRSSRARIVSRLARLADRAGELNAQHPRLAQPMRLVDHAFFIAEHDDHHLARITLLLGDPDGGKHRRGQAASTGGRRPPSAARPRRRR